MEVNTPEYLSTTQGLPLAYHHIRSEAISLHQTFQARQDSPSYHNSLHVITTISSALSLIEASTKGQDPLNLKGDLSTFNTDHGTDFDLGDFLYISGIAFSLHDTGNIGQLEDGQINFLPKYTAKQAEDRSRAIASHIISQNTHLAKLPPQKLAGITLLVNHLISQTIFDIDDSNPPFSIFAKLCDQVGSNLLLNDQDRLDQQIGLIRENKGEDPSFYFDPHKSANFLSHRFQILIPSDQTRPDILQIWDRPEPLSYTPDQAEKLFSNLPDQP